MGEGNAIPYGLAQAWCPSIEAADHEFLQIEDMRSRIAQLTAVLAALRACPPADAWDRAGAMA